MSKNAGERSSPSAEMALACLFAALCCAGAYISVPLPIGPVPLALSNFFAVLGGLLLGPVWGAVSALLYVAAGAVGFPVFSGGRGGLAHLIGPTGGYLAGYIVGAAVAGLFARKRSLRSAALGAIAGFAAVLVLGALGLYLLSGLPVAKALAVGVLPFLPGDAVKAALAAVVCGSLGPFADSLVRRRPRHG
jgi:biotin transport system substrate-specific component